MKDIKLAKAEIESTLIYHIRPHFISISDESTFIHVIIAHPKFKNVPIPNRINLIFSLLKEYNPDIFNMWTVIIECLDSVEMQDALEYLL